MARKAKAKKNRTGLLGKTRGMLRVSLKQSKKKADKSGYTAPKKRTGANAGSKAMAKATAAGRTGGAKKARNDKLVIKNRKLNKSAKAMAGATMAGKASTTSKLSRFGKLKLAAKQKALNIKGKAKAIGRKGGSMSAKHRKAISDGLKKRFRRG